MKFKIFLFFLLCLSSAAYSQTTVFKYSYDASGNRTSRTIEIIPAPPGQAPPMAEEQMAQKQNAALSDSTNLSTPETTTLKTAVVYPNPTFGLININLESFKNSTYQLFDISGKEIQRGVIYSSQTILDISNEGSGQYLLRITSSGQVQSFSIIKKS